MSNSIQSKHVMIMAAGTGGHVFPALAVAKKLKQYGYQISWLATPTGMENRLLEKEDIQIFQIDIQGIRGNGILRKLWAPFKIFKAVLSARQFMSDHHVDVVVGFGGYVAGPGGLAAKSLGIPLLIHEQNAIAGFTNTQLSKIAQTICQAFPDTFPKSSKVFTTGNPIRDDIAQILSTQWRYDERDKLGLPLQVLVVGGSLGAQALNKNVPDVLKSLNLPLKVFHQCGQQQLEETQKRYAGANQIDIEVQPFIDDMAKAYREADLVICRAGALTVTEIATAGVAAVFIPLPTAVDDHQTANANYLVKQGAAKICSQNEIYLLADLLSPLMDRKILSEMAVKARHHAQPQATEQVVNLIEQLV